MSYRAALRLALPALCALFLARPLPAAELDVHVFDTQGAPLRDAVVALLPVGKPLPPAAHATAEIDQRNLSFTPQVLVVQTGTQVTFPNSDNVRHQVYSFSPAKRFELKLYSGTHASSELFDKAGLVTLGCNIHDWMLGYIYVVETPWFGKSDASGSIHLDVPAGRYTLQLWHPRTAAPGPIDVPVMLGDSVTERRFTLAVHPAEQTNAPPPGLEIGLDQRMNHDDAH